MAHWKSVVDFLFALIALLCYLLWFRVMRRSVYSWAVFIGIDLSALKLCTFYVSRVVPINYSWHQKTRDTELRRWRPHRWVFPRFGTISECDWQTDGRTDGQTDMPSVAYTALAARCRMTCRVLMSCVFVLNPSFLKVFHHSHLFSGIGYLFYVLTATHNVCWTNLTTLLVHVWQSLAVVVLMSAAD